MEKRFSGRVWLMRKDIDTDIIAPTQKTVDALSHLEMPAGVYIDIKMKNK